MQLLASDVEKIPPRNLRVPLTEFVAVWIAAERQQDECGRLDWAGGGIVAACRWLGRATIRPKTGPWRMAVSPITRNPVLAYEELIEAECLAAERLLHRRPVHVWVRDRPGWVENILATLNWAWRREGNPPIEPITISTVDPAAVQR